MTGEEGTETHIFHPSLDLLGDDWLQQSCLEGVFISEGNKALNSALIQDFREEIHTEQCACVCLLTLGTKSLFNTGSQNPEKVRALVRNGGEKEPAV